MNWNHLNPADIRTTWDLVATDAPVELRVLRRDGPPSLGRFTQAEAFEQAVRQADAQPDTTGIYVALNPLRPDAPWTGRLNILRTGGQAAKDGDIASRRWLLVDLDPRRPAKTNATDTERQAAFEKAGQIGRTLRHLGWPDPVQATSGNGAHLLYRVDLENSPDSTSKIQTVLKTLATRFSDESVDVDSSVFNASRISKIYGTTPKKGEQSTDRPFHPAQILVAPPRLVPVPSRLLDSLPAILLPPDQRPPIIVPRHWNVAQSSLAPVEDDAIQTFAQLLRKWGVEVTGRPTRGWIPVRCPWEREHSGSSGRPLETAISLAADGRPGFKCFHAHCSDRHFRDFAKINHLPISSRRPPLRRAVGHGHSAHCETEDEWE